MANQTNSSAGYKYLLTYKYSVVIHDLTVEFCRRFLPGRELLRQRDQMTQAARSGKQNIVEGHELQSLEGYIKLLGVAEGSLKELLEDYEDFLRQKELRLWPKDGPKMRGMRELRVVEEPAPHLPQFPHIPQDPEVAANLLVMLCQRTTYFLGRQIESLREKFVKEGGFRENLFRQRMKFRRQHPPTTLPDPQGQALPAGRQACKPRSGGILHNRKDGRTANKSVSRKAATIRN